MILPSDIKVGAYLFRLLALPLEDAYGETSTDDLTITIDPHRNRHPSILADTLLHETIHAALFAAGLASDEDEAFVTAFTPQLRQVLIDNPALIDAIRR